MSLGYHFTKPADFDRINSKHLGELLWWSYNLDATPEKLVTIIEEIGESTQDVKRYLATSRLSSDIVRSTNSE